MGFDASSVLSDGDVVAVLEATLGLAPVEADDGQGLDCSEVDEGAWAEGTVTWNTKPDAGEHQDTVASGGDPHEWDVTSAVEAAFDTDGQTRVGFLIEMQEGLAGETNAVEYDSREADGGQATLEVRTRERRRADVDATVTASRSGTADLSAFLEVKFFHERWLGARGDTLLDANQDPYVVSDLAWDPTRERFWGVEAAAGAVVRRHQRDGLHEATFEVHEDGAQLDRDLHSVAVDDEGNVYLGLDSGSFDTDGDVVQCTVDETDGVLRVETRYTAHDVNPDWLAFDGTRVWLLDFFAGEVEQRHPSNWALNRSGSVGNGDTYRGIAKLPDHDELVLLNDASGELELQDPDDLGTVTGTFDRGGVFDTGEGLAFRGRSWYGTLFLGDSGTTGSQVWTLAPREVSSTLLVPTPGHAEAAAQVQPSSIPGDADLASQVATGSEADLSTALTPLVPGEAVLDGAVQPANLEGLADVTSIAEVAPVPIGDDHAARAEGRIAPTVVVDEDDVADVSGEVGNAITLDPDGEARELRRVVQLLDGQRRYPRARAEPATTLHRGDAVLYAQRGDALEPGDEIRWQDRDWRVAGLLGWAMVGDSRLYQEVGLRRLATVHEARAVGTVS